MGLDWVVIAKEKDGKEINPTDILGAKRASRFDSEVVGKLRDIHTSRGERSDFDDWLSSLIAQDPAPIVIPFGPEYRDAVPGVQAEVQYYGFRGKALETEINRLSEFAVAKGNSMDWIWQDLDTEDKIKSSIQKLTSTLEAYSALHPRPYNIAKQRFDSWRSEDLEGVNKADQEIASDADMQDHVFEIFTYLAAILWLSFWQDKGFKIAADF
jgi:hypothetical protein